MWASVTWSAAVCVCTGARWKSGSASQWIYTVRVVLEYRETNRPATEADIQAGSKQIELIETAEVPVVQKVARVVEEVHVGKVETDRTEVVQDSVRHTEVQVENVDGDEGLSGVTRR